MASLHRVYLEVGSKRTFACALEWPGWCRSGRDQDAALSALVAYVPRYVEALGPAAGEFALPADVADLEVVERVEGNATTDFGAPGVPAPSDDWPLRAGELDRLLGLLEACWAAFDRTARSGAGLPLRKGPRGGGRELDAIVRHVVEADGAYLNRLGGSYRKPAAGDVAEEAALVRGAMREVLERRAGGESPPLGRRRAPLWPLRYGIRRSAWHALDHAWEIEDRAEAPSA